MKKIITSLLLLSLVIVSCSDNDTSPAKIQTANVVFKVDQPSSAVTGKQIKKDGSIPVWVSEIRIDATSNVFANYTVGEPFTFDNQNGDSFMSLNDVAIGSNTFVASTKTDSPQFYQLTNFTSNAATLDARFDAAYANINKDNPYVLYSGSTTSNISATGTNAVNIPMLTSHGRILTVFSVNDKLKSLGLQAKITASVPGEQDLTAITKGNELVTFKWSNTKSLHDKEVTYKVEVSAINAQQTILKTYSISQKIVASSSIWCFNRVDEDGITIKTNSNKITLNFQEWKTEQCPTCN